MSRYLINPSLGYRGEPYWPYTVLLVSCEGANNSTTFSDLTGRHTTTAFGNAKIDTADGDFPNGALLLDGVSDYLASGGVTASDYSFGPGDFTLECYAKHTAFQANENWLMGNYNGPGSGIGFYINASAGAGINLALRAGDAIIVTRAIAITRPIASPRSPSNLRP